MVLIEIRTLPRTNPIGRGKPPRWLIFDCDVCGKRFEGSYTKYAGKLKQKRQVCSIDCFYRDDRHYRNGSDIACSQCGKQSYVPVSQQNERWGNFCDRSCYWTYRTAHPELYETNLKAFQTKESKERARKTRNARLKSGEIIHPWIGRRHSEESKTKMSESHKRSGHAKGDRNPMKKGHTEASKQKMSDTRSRLMIEGKIKPYEKGPHKKGDFVSTKVSKTFFYRSSWELALMEHLERDPNVVTYQHEGVRIPYYYNEKKRWYVPDFVVLYTNGSKKMFEIKPKEFVDDLKTQLKAEAGRSYCRQNGINEYKFLTRSVLVEMGVI